MITCFESQLNLKARELRLSLFSLLQPRIASYCTLNNLKFSTMAGVAEWRNEEGREIKRASLVAITFKHPTLGTGREVARDFRELCDDLEAMEKSVGLIQCSFQNEWYIP